MTDPLTSRAGLLGWWRTRHTTLGLDAVGRSVNVAAATVHNWESGHTDGPGVEQLRALDARYGAGGALHGLYEALRTPKALDPAVGWWFNFQGESGPCWAWVRVDGDRAAQAEADAGPFRVEFEVPPRHGVFVQAWAFTSNPAVHVAIGAPGWVDFGYGELPADVGAPVVDAVDVAIVGPRGSLDPALLTASNSFLPYLLGRETWFDKMKRQLGRRIEVARHAMSRLVNLPWRSVPSDLSGAGGSRDEVPRHWPGERYRHLRQARGLSLTDVAALASAREPSLPPVTRDHVHRLEHGSTPRVPELVQRLDMVLGADGRTCAVALDEASMRAVDGGFDLVFPAYWIGPVWIQFLRTGDQAGAKAELLWKPWSKSLVPCDGVVVTTRRSTRASGPLRVTLPPGWEVRAGVGVHPRAIDVNEGWGLTREAAYDTLSHYYGVVVRALRLDKD